jgi:surface protein
MKSINQYIIEKLKITTSKYKYFPVNKTELKKIIKERIETEGNNVNLNDIDTSEITDMSALFNSRYLTDFCGDVSDWDVSNVTSMNHMFCGCKNFNCDLSEWDVSKVKNMRSMFYECYSFEGIGLENWNVSNLEIIEGAFGDCIKLTGKELENWDVSNVKYAIDTFYGCKNLSCNLDNWNMSNCKEMDDMFYACKNMNIPKCYKK